MYTMQSSSSSSSQMEMETNQMDSSIITDDDMAIIGRAPKNGATRRISLPFRQNPEDRVAPAEIHGAPTTRRTRASLPTDHQTPLKSRTSSGNLQNTPTTSRFVVEPSEDDLKTPSTKKEFIASTNAPVKPHVSARISKQFHQHPIPLF